MTEAIPRAVVEAFYQAYRSRDPERIGMFVDEDVDWASAGPVEVMRFCGAWRGKAAVMDRFRNVLPQIIKFKTLDIEALLVDGDQSAMFGRITCIHRETGRLICHRTSHVARTVAARFSIIASSTTVSTPSNSMSVTASICLPIPMTGPATSSPCDAAAVVWPGRTGPITARRPALQIV